MKRILLILTSLLLPVALHAGVGDVAAQADALYRSGDYEAAIVQYESVLAGGYASADLYYNLGNAYYRTDQTAQAILNYKRALRLAPGMRDARENLELADARTVDRIAVMPKLFIVRWIDALCTHIMPSVWRVIWVVILALLGVSVVLFCLGRTRGMRKTGLVAGVLMLLLLLLATWLLLCSTSQYNAHREAVVMPQAVTVKSSPEASSVDKLILHEGTVVTVSDSLSGWYKITLSDGTTGWCLSSDIERI